MTCCSINVTEVYAGMRPGEEAKTIAAVVLVNDLVLITGNLKGFPMPELRLYPLSM